ncbi:unnamed protein product [Phytophthora lilii]|uniref:Unnamed protein product n=1 Tax=Phytophthora lilii TaxID=2077276 RepID=A0A9W7D9J8_9STRA|nr:unnamed protein product [Phytophthora lilii]
MSTLPSQHVRQHSCHTIERSLAVDVDRLHSNNLLSGSNCKDRQMLPQRTRSQLSWFTFFISSKGITPAGHQQKPSATPTNKPTTATASPPLFTRMSTGPKLSSALVTRFCTSWRLVTSVAAMTTLPVAPISPSMLVLTASSASRRRAPSATLAPAFASSSAIATTCHEQKVRPQIEHKEKGLGDAFAPAPMPPEAPVTTATLPLNCVLLLLIVEMIPCQWIVL